MDTSYLSQQVTTIVSQLHGYFDDIGIPTQERDSREAELFTALSETLHDQLKLVASEKNELTEQARQLIRTIRQMEASLDDTKARDDYDLEDEELRVTHPLLQCIEQLKQKHKTISRLHRERYEQVKTLAQALTSWAMHLEPSFVTIKLPPTQSNEKVPPTFDISPSYLTSLDEEYTRVYEEYKRRVALIQSMAEEMVMLWTELGTPQAQIDSTIVKHYRENPEQLGLHQDDITRIKAKRQKLVDEKLAREKRLKDLRSTIEQLWEKLSIPEAEQRAFLASNRGCGMRAINEFEDELKRLEDMKRQNLHIFVEDARFKLQALWDSLYFSDEEMLEFEPAFITDVYSDALLSAHESEIARLEALQQQRAPILVKVDKYRTIWQERLDLQASSQDASRLLAKGTKGEKRDPTRLLREEKMRKRVEKELPKVEQDLMATLEAWEEEYGRPFLVHGRRFVDEIMENSEERSARGGKHAASARAKTPTNPLPAANANTKTARTAPPASRNGTLRGPAPQQRSKTPTHTMGRNVLATSVSSHLPPSTAKPSVARNNSVRTSPSKIPARQPLGTLTDGKNSPERRPRAAAGLRNAADEHNYAGPKLASPGKLATYRTMGPPTQRIPPPPKMKDLFPDTPTPANFSSSTASDLSSVIVRHAAPDDPYWARHASNSTLASVASRGFAPSVPASRIPSGDSENWESYGNDDEDYEVMRRNKRATPDDGEEQFGQKRVALGLGVGRLAPRVVEREGTVGSEGWTDEGSVF